VVLAVRVAVVVSMLALALVGVGYQAKEMLVLAVLVQVWDVGAAVLELLVPLA
jgi:hypothetical protein